MERSAPTPLEPNSVEGPNVSVVGKPDDTGGPCGETYNATYMEAGPRRRPCDTHPGSLTTQEAHDYDQQ